MSEAQETYSLLPVEECAIHPLARIRFDYGDTGDLAESMKMMGQVQPGKATEQAHADGAGARYLVYIGCRRLVACKKASLKYFKAIVVKEVDEGRLQRELLTENVKRANLSVLEELNMLANYSKHLYSLDELSKDIGLSQRLVRERVMLATRIQGKNLVETFYKIERISGFSFTYRHIEKITALEEDKWLALAIHAAELNWKA
jgi:ParB family chromosome partitioning protein